MTYSFFTEIKPLKFIKCALIPALSFSAFSATASEYNYAIELDEPYPYIFKDGIEKAIDVNLYQTFATIENVCLEGKVESGNPITVENRATSAVEGGLIFGVGIIDSLIPEIRLIEDPDNPGEYIPLTSPLENIDICLVLPNNFTDGIATFNLTFEGDDLTVTSLNLIINGVLDNTQILSELSTDDVLSADGGALAFSTQITNTDIDFSEKHFRTWSHVTFPNGDTYPVKGPRKLNLQYQETKTIDTRFFVPDWFSAGEYTLTVYAADTLSGDRVTSSFNFTKIAEEETITE